MHDSVPNARYFCICTCNVLHLWRIWLIPTYRVYQLYDIYFPVQFLNICNLKFVLHNYEITKILSNLEITHALTTRIKRRNLDIICIRSQELTMYISRTCNTCQICIHTKGNTLQFPQFVFFHSNSLRIK